MTLDLQASTTSTDIDYISIAHRCYGHNRTDNAHIIIVCHCCDSDVANVSFHPSLLTSRAVDVKIAHRYYDTWSLQQHIKLGQLL
jgi:hypothetical protein